MQILVLTHRSGGARSTLPALELLSHTVKELPPEPTALVGAPAASVIFIDATADLVGARGLARVLRVSGNQLPVILIIGEGGLAAVQADWGFDDLLLATAGPAEIDARIRIAANRGGTEDAGDTRISVGEIVIDEEAYTARLRGRVMDLTYKEFELLKYLAQHTGRVITRAQLLQEVWGYDYFGGTRTVDVHIRRLRAKLGSDHESLIGTVRNVGYRIDAPPRDKKSADR